MKVHDHSGQAWRVTRRWVPWRRKLKGWLEAMPNLPVSMTDDGPLAAIAFVLLMLLLVPFLLLALLGALEFLALLVVFPFALLARVVLGRHWTVEARRGFEPWFEMEAGRWGASRDKIHEISAAIRRGELPPRTVEE